jgi:hypothetical protein
MVPYTALGMPVRPPATRATEEESRMSTSTPMEAGAGREDDGIPAADPGAGAPPPAEGFGVGGEEPDRPEEADASPADDPGRRGDDEGRRGNPPFRTPDPGDVSRG